MCSTWYGFILLMTGCVTMFVTLHEQYLSFPEGSCLVGFALIGRQQVCSGTFGKSLHRGTGRSGVNSWISRTCKVGMQPCIPPVWLHWTITSNPWCLGKVTRNFTSGRSEPLRWIPRSSDWTSSAKAYSWWTFWKGTDIGGNFDPRILEHSWYKYPHVWKSDGKSS